jgi:hypothetical protein
MFLENLQATAAVRERPLPPSTLSILSGDLADVFAIFLDQLADVSPRFRRVHAGIGNRPAEADVVADVVDALRVLEKFFDVDLSNAEPSVFVASVVRLLVIAH